MKLAIILKYLSSLHKRIKNRRKGFTLLELLIVILFIGVLAAVAIPTFLGQVGKAREIEAKNAVGTVNRAQQAYHFQEGKWSGPLNNSQLQAINVLSVNIPPSKYYKFTIDGVPTGFTSTILAEGIESFSGTVDDGQSQGTRNYSGLVEFVTTSSQYNLILCQANVPGTVGLAPINTSTCAANYTEVR